MDDSVVATYFKFVIPVALLPAIAWYFGSVEVGWQLGDREQAHEWYESAEYGPLKELRESAGTFSAVFIDGLEED